MRFNYICGLKIHSLRFLLLFLLLFVLMTACFDQPDCLVTATNTLQIVLYKQERHSKDTAISFASIRVSGSDSVYYDSTVTGRTTNNILYLPIDPRHTSTTYLLSRYVIVNDSTVAKGPTDTLVVDYSMQSKVISTECGAYTYFKDLHVLKSTFTDEQIKILNASLLYDPTTQKYATNLQIFY